MGIKPSYIKSTGHTLLNRFGDRFSSDFDGNKQAVMEVTSIGSKKMRNRIAGYITRKVHTGRR
ncbi:MAG: 30S ribosomal protein S17e [Methanomicrobiales archaeon]|jgi:small subunit ribosomal protein S17e|nr:30S ribosomal protein S17e [Methanomicrobiales archaeon]